MATRTFKRDFSLVVWVFGWLVAVAVILKKVIEKRGVPFDAFARLENDAGVRTIEKIVELVYQDWLDERPKPVENAGGVPYRDTPLLSSLKPVLPTAMTIAGRTYDFLNYLRGDERSVTGDVMVARSKEMNAHLGKEDGEHLLAHQDEIPVALRDKVAFVFTVWRDPDDSGRVACVYWLGDRWLQYWRWLDGDWYGSACVLRRK